MKTILVAILVGLAMIGGAAASANAWAGSGSTGGQLGLGWTNIPVDTTGATATSFGPAGGIATSGYLTSGQAVSFTGNGAIMASNGASNANAASLFNVANANSAAGAVAVGPFAVNTVATGTTSAIAGIGFSGATSTSYSQANAL
jgi:hypothetical protein